jgi:uncharacterized membrane protein
MMPGLTMLTKLLAGTDDILRRRPWTIQSAPAGAAVFRLAGNVLLFGMLYGAAMGLFEGIGGERLWLVAYAAIKVPLLLLVTFLIGLPSFFVLNTLFGLRRDFVQALRALVAAQAGLAIVLASLAPFTLLWYASSADYSAALRCNGLMFAVASLSGQRLLWAYYRPLVRRNIKHRQMLWTWLAIYVFVGIQMAWVLRPFVGAPGTPVQFFRQQSWGNAYDVVARLIYDAVVH